jgi:hypothetical protein
VKDNQPTLKADVERFFETSRQAPGWHPPEMPQEIAQTTNKSRGRVETRRLIAMPNQDNYIQWPGLEQVFQLERRVVHPAQGKETTELFYGITSLAYQPGSAAELLEWSRQHWGIENGLHYRRDVTLREDDTRMSDTHQARVLATINNFVVALARCLGIDNLASARRFFQAKLDLALFSS